MGRSIKNVMAGLSAREQRLVAIMGGMFVVFVIFLMVFLFNNKVAELEERSENLTEAMRLFEEKSGDYVTAEQKKAQRISNASNKPTPLSTIVDKASKKVEIDPPDTKELPDLKHGTQWVEHAVELNLREIDILKLTLFMEEIESNRRRFPIAISKLDVNRRKRAADFSYQVKMTVSTYEQVVEESTVPDKKSGRKSARRK